MLNVAAARRPFPEMRTALPVRGSASARFWGVPLCVLSVIAWILVPLGYEFAVQFLAIVGIAAVVMGFAYPALGALGMGLLLTMDVPMRTLVLTGGLLRYNTVNYILIGCGVLFAGRIVRKRDVHSMLLACFSIALTIGLFYRLPYILTSGIQDVLCVVAVFGMVGCLMRATNDPEIWKWIGLVNGLASAIGSLLFLTVFGGTGEINHNAFAAYPLTGLASICLALLTSQEKQVSRSQILLVYLAGANVAAIFLTGSRGTLLTALACLVALFSVRALKKQLMKRLAHLAIVGTLVFAGTNFSSDLTGQAVRRLEKLFNEDVTLAGRTSGRALIAQIGWRVFLDSPGGLGVGTGHFPYAFAEVDVGSKTGRHKFAHSGWVKVLAENGIVGTPLFLAYVFSFAWVGWKRKSLGGLAPGLVTTLVLAVGFLSTEFQAKGLWFMAASCTVLFHYSPVYRLGPADLRPAPMAGRRLSPGSAPFQRAGGRSSR